MRKGIIVSILLFVLAYSCKNDETINYLTLDKAVYYFSEVEKICTSEKGQLWGANLYGPVLLVNSDNREIYSNFQDAEGILKPRGEIFYGHYPREEIINNYAVTFGNTLFAMTPLPRNEDEYRIISRSIHGLFHCFQVKTNTDTPVYNTSHLNERTARFWTKMEWKALVRAIRTSGKTRKQAIRDALVFRSARYEMYPRFIEEERKFENYEGVTTFTYTYMCNPDRETETKKLLEQEERFYNFRSYSHSYGFIAGALYAYLLNESGFDFRSLTSSDFNLGDITAEQYKIKLPEICRDIAGSLAFNYDLDIVNQEEQEREALLKEGLRKRVAKYTERPVIFLELESPSFSFEPEDIDPVDTVGTIYETLRVSDNWGKLSINKGGCLVSSDLEIVRVPAKNIKRDKNHISGDGWHIILNNNWEMVEVEENYIITKLIP